MKMDMLKTGTLVITLEILNIIAELDEFKGAWKALGRPAPTRLAALRRVTTMESAGSSMRIAGSCLSDNEVERVLDTLAAKSLGTQDEQDVAEYIHAMEQIFQSRECVPLCESLVLQLHSDLLCYSDRDAWHRGSYRHSPNRVAPLDADGQPAGTVFATATPLETPRLMAELISWTNATLETRALHPLLVLGIFTATFLAIHPFEDGDGCLHAF